jgi:hypothetical protein
MTQDTQFIKEIFMKVQRLIIALLVISIVSSLYGCANDENVHETMGSNSEIIENEDFVPESSTANEEHVVVTGEQFVWEKPEQQIALDSIKLTEKWHEYIDVGGAIISTIDFTDISVIHNYYYGNNDSYADLETAYYVPTFSLSTKTDTINFDTYVSANLDIISTTFKDEVGGKKVIIEEIRFISTINPYEGGIEILKTDAYFSEGTFGIGSSYEYVVGLIGEPTAILTEDIGDVNSSTCIYTAENAEMILSFMWFEQDGVESAVITSIDWIPTTIRSILHTQPGIERFEGYTAIQ